MRKSIIVCVWLFFFALPIFGGDKGFVSAGAGAVFPSDERFKDIYGTLHFSPELKAGYMFCENFYLWLGYSFFSATRWRRGAIPSARPDRGFYLMWALTAK